MEQPWYEKKPLRFQLEKKLIQRHHPDAVMFICSKTGRLMVLKKVQGRRGSYLAKIVFSQDHPLQPPESFSCEPEIRGTPHSLPEESNRLCLFPPELATPSLTGKTILDLTCDWFRCYETWLDTGDWPPNNTSV